MIGRISVLLPVAAEAAHPKCSGSCHCHSVLHQVLALSQITGMRLFILSHFLVKNSEHRAREMAQAVKALAIQPGDRRSIPRTHTVEGELTPAKFSSDLHTLIGTSSKKRMQTLRRGLEIQ